MVFCIIEFEDGLSLVPSIWLSDDKTICFYPTNYNRVQLESAIKSFEKPNSKNIHANWKMYDVVRMFGTAETYARGKQKLKLAENASDIETENDESLNEKLYTQKKEHHANFEFADDIIATSSKECDAVTAIPIGLEKNNFKVIATYQEPTIPEESLSQPSTNTAVQGLLVKLLEKQVLLQLSIDEIRKEQIKQYKEVMMKIEILTAPYSNAGTSNVLSNAFKNFPLETEQELNNLESKLANKTFASDFAMYLSAKGGTNAQDVTRRILKSCLTDKLAQQYSWGGKTNKNLKI